MLRQILRRALCPALALGLCAVTWFALNLAVAGARPATPPTLTVNSSSDVPAGGDLTNGLCQTTANNAVCTLRAAIMKANHFPGGGATIHLPSGLYLLTIPPSGSDDESSGDLNITNTMTLVGDGAATTIIDGNGGVITDHVFTIASTVTISGVTIQHASSSTSGGGIYNGGSLTLLDTAVLSNTAGGLNGRGGGIYNAGPLTLTNSLVRGNQTSSTNAIGGGIFNQGPLLVIDSTIADNTTSGNDGLGGGLYNSFYTATVVASTISGNSAVRGGGIYKVATPLIVINSTISGNHASDNGGGIYASTGSTSLFNVTVAFNEANSDGTGSDIGGGVYNDCCAGGSTLSFINSIIANNKTLVLVGKFPVLTDDDCAGTITSQGFSIVFHPDATHCTVSGPFTQTDPKLGPLQANGGPSETHALAAGSPAVDAGQSPNCTDALGAPITTDQRGGLRPSGGCDIGSYEYGATPVLSTLNPLAAIVNGPSFVLTLNGSGFISGASARWNGSTLSTTFVSGTQLTANVPAGDLSASGTYSLTVLNPGPGDGASNPLPFAVTPHALYLPLIRR